MSFSSLVHVLKYHKGQVFPRATKQGNHHVSATQRVSETCWACLEFCKFSVAENTKKTKKKKTKRPWSRRQRQKTQIWKNLTQNLNESMTTEKCDSPPQNHIFQFSLFKVTPDRLWRGVAVKGSQPNVMIRYQRRAGWHATELPRPPEIIS